MPRILINEPKTNTIGTNTINTISTNTVSTNTINTNTVSTNTINTNTDNKLQMEEYIDINISNELPIKLNNNNTNTLGRTLIMLKKILKCILTNENLIILNEILYRITIININIIINMYISISIYDSIIEKYYSNNIIELESEIDL